MQQQNIELMKPVIALITYRMGSLNEYDISLLNYCHKLDLDPIVSLAIYFAERKEDIEEISKIYFPYNNTALMKILQLKKLSAEKKFRENYGMTDGDVPLLMEKYVVF